MKPLRVMLIAGEPSGDMLAAELVGALRNEAAQRNQSLEFSGAGGAHMANAGVELAFDMTKHSVIGLIEALKSYFKFRALLNQLVCLALAEQPDIIVCVDFSGFNRRFAHALRSLLKPHLLRVSDWKPKIVQYVSPQVWASRPGRAKAMARDYDLLLVIFPFERAWYAERFPGFRVEFVGHPMMDRFANAARTAPREGDTEMAIRRTEPEHAEILLLPGSRTSELKRHLPVMLGAIRQISQAQPETTFRMVLPDEKLSQLASTLGPLPDNLRVQIGGLADALRSATIAIASTGTVTMECAYFGVPTVAMYQTSWSTYQIGKRIVKVPFLAMPNILANEALYPEFIQNAATPENLSRAALELLDDSDRRAAIKTKLAGVITSLGEPGAAGRAARAVLSLVAPS